MKLKYYLRGIGIGIIVTTIILTISFSGRKEEISDEEVIARATQLGMVMQEDEPVEEETESTEQRETQVGDMSEPEETEDTQALESSGQEESGIQQPKQESISGQNDAIERDMSQNDTVSENESEMFRLIIQKGDVCRVVCEKLAEGGVITDSEALRKYLFEIGYASNMSVGQYDIPYGASNQEIAEILEKGPVE